jgi:hypothetical protein
MRTSSSPSCARFGGRNLAEVELRLGRLGCAGGRFGVDGVREVGFSDVAVLVVLARRLLVGDQPLVGGHPVVGDGVTGVAGGELVLGALGGVAGGGGVQSTRRHQKTPEANDDNQ